MAGALAIVGCGSTADDNSVSTADGNRPAVGGSIIAESLSGDIAYRYFGSVELAKGSTLNTTVSDIASSDDVAVTDTPRGITVELTDGDGGTTNLMLEVGQAADVGPQTITFAIVGEPDPVAWTIEVLAP